MAKLSASAFADFLVARARAKDGYIMGATGQNPKTLSSWWFNQYSGSQYTKAIYWKNHAERVWDCNGLAEGYYRDQTGQSINTRARYNYASWCGAKGKGMIPADRRAKGAAVFWGATEKDITHVAFLVRPVDEGAPEGDWYMVEARGVKYGVVETRLLARKSAYWGWMDRYFDYGSEAPAQTPTPTSTPNGENLLYVTGDRVNIREGPGTRFESVGVANKGDALAGANAEGWTMVEYGNGVKWISSKYIQKGES